MPDNWLPIVMEVVTDPVEIAAANAQRLRIADRPGECVAHHVERRVEAVDIHAHTRGLAGAIVADDDLMPVGLLRRLACHEFNGAGHPPVAAAGDSLLLGCGALTPDDLDPPV